MGQVDDDWFQDDPWGEYTIVGCDRYSCTVQAKAFSFLGPWELLPQHAHLVEPPEDRDGDA